MGNNSGGLSRNQQREQALASQDLAKKRARLAIERENRKKTLQIASPLVSAGGERGILGFGDGIRGPAPPPARLGPG